MTQNWALNVSSVSAISEINTNVDSLLAYNLSGQSGQPSYVHYSLHSVHHAAAL